MIILWIIQVLLELVIEVIENKIDFVVAGWNQDIEDLKKPATVVGDVFKKITGQEVSPAPEKSREIQILDKRIAEKQKSKKK